MFTQWCNSLCIYRILLLAAVDVHYSMIERDCIEVPINDNNYRDGCHDDLPFNEVVRYLVEQTFEGTNLADVTFSGKSCFYSEGING